MLHPDYAILRGISDGATINIFNDRGRMTCSAKLTTDVMRGVVAIHSGYWRGRSSCSVNVLSSAEAANIGQAPTFSDVAVESG